MGTAAEKSIVEACGDMADKRWPMERERKARADLQGAPSNCLGHGPAMLIGFCNQWI
jgi:hypothetical protein